MRSLKKSQPVVVDSEPVVVDLVQLREQAQVRRVAGNDEARALFKSTLVEADALEERADAAELAERKEAHREQCYADAARHSAVHGVQKLDRHAAAASSYSWMRPPRRSRRAT